ncbi:hypothetical protein AMTRI_Chr04g249590 [Amborella trichopoda]
MHYMLKGESINAYKFVRVRARDTLCRERIGMDLCRPTLCFMSFVIIFLIITQSVPSASQEVEDEREFNYLEDSERGPKHWGELYPEWRACSNGDMQSPIDLLHERVEVLPNLGRLQRKYKPAKAILKNRGHDIMLKWGKSGAGTLEINQTDYVLKQCHWHSPSEHTFNGSRYHLEVHLVHQSKDGKNAVVGITYKIGRPDTFLKELMGNISSIADSKNAEAQVGVVDPRHIKMGSRKYYRYMGSLTTPPCTQGVAWNIVKKVRTVSREQLRLLRAAVHDEAEANARPTQPINKRVVDLYTPRRLSPALHFLL